MNKKSLTVIVIAVSVIFIYQLSQSVSSSLNVITANLKTEEEVSASLNILQSNVTGNHKMLKNEQLKGSTHSESITAQQIERFLSFNQKNMSILENIQGNLDYYKNPTAVLFYLSYAYKELGNYQKALDLLGKIIEINNTRYSYLYIFNAKRLDSRVYYVPVKAELLLRRAEIYYLMKQKTEAAKNLNSLLSMADSSYGYGDIVFLYSELAAKNIRRMKQDLSFISSRDKFYSAANAKHLVKTILTSESKKMISNYVSEEYSSLIFDSVYTDQEKFIDDYEILQPKFDNMPTNNFSVDLINYGIRKGFDLYHFQAAGYDFEILNKVNDQYLLRLQ